ncbi:MAG: hypothetical protein ABIP48_33690 [Planctomycetota bacterium]
MANLFEMNADGSNIRQLGHNTQFEGHGSLMPDGRILYTRWEYVDKHYASAYGLWTMNADGTNQCLYYGGYAWQPSSVIDARIIPSTEKFVCIYTTVHNLPLGAMVVVDRQRDLDGTEPILKSWPADIAQYMAHWDKVDRVGNEFDSHHPVAVNWNHYNHKRIVGKVPIEADGSAYFSVPAGRFVYFQLLDENDMMIHSMRSGTTVQPGETAGCVGCHESRLQSVPKASDDRYVPLALGRPPSRIESWYGPPRNFSTIH